MTAKTDGIHICIVPWLDGAVTRITDQMVRDSYIPPVEEEAEEKEPEDI